MIVLILTGGLGTRISSIAKDRPKGMIEINGRPFLEYLIYDLVNKGFPNQILLLGHKAEYIMEHFGDGREHSANIIYSMDKRLVGTAGSLKNCENFLNFDTFFVINGDTYTDVNLNEMYDLHKASGADASICIKEIDNKKDESLKNYAGIKINKNNEMVSYNEKSSGDFISCGIYCFEKSIFNYLKKGANLSLEYDLIPQLLKNNHKINSYVYSGSIFDIGTPEELSNFSKYIPDKKWK